MILEAFWKEERKERRREAIEQSIHQACCHDEEKAAWGERSDHSNKNHWIWTQLRWQVEFFRMIRRCLQSSDIHWNSLIANHLQRVFVLNK